MIPPTYFKMMSNPFLIQIWNKAEYELRESEKIVFCGYSMPDADIHIKYLLKRGILNRRITKPKIIIVNNHDSKKDEIKNEEELRYRRLFGAKINYTEKNLKTLHKIHQCIYRKLWLLHP
ncbi:hypothetical protein RBH29_05665 [Herbivorax sp. ANBcel31]|uniref:hypothetical protein n=1 Tax=Herbivorax sp. ANBcel31 TaxID=3069754 RepID=UPI0027B2E080|nr:hypothetical protein [Herbivorax sp. ANBcel31]MDQ2085925.1 hypothetical protein [Herbivorax sp. ANBcel31]